MIIILGGGFSKTSLSQASFERVQACKNIYKKQKTICSGHGTGCNISEAQLMAELLVDIIPLEKIVIEDKSYDTIQNAYYCLQIIKKLPKQIVVVTHEFHAQRTRQIFEWMYNVPIHIHEVPNLNLPKQAVLQRKKHEQQLMHINQKTLLTLTHKQLKSFIEGNHPVRKTYTKEIEKINNTALY